MLCKMLVRFTTTRAVPIRKHVQTLSLAVPRVDVHHRVEQIRFRQSKKIKPKSFDVALFFDVVGKEVARQPNVVITEVKVRSEEADEEAKQFWI